MPALEIDFAALATATGQSEDDLSWLIEQICPRGVGASLQAANSPIAMAVNGTEVLGVVEDYIGYASLGDRNAEYLPIAGCHAQFGVSGTTETLTLTMGATTLSLALDSADTIRISTVGDVFKYLRNNLIARKRV